MMMENQRRFAGPVWTWGMAGTLALASSNLFASSFALIEQSVNGMGTAYAIGSAGISDASTVYFNPAGMSRLSGTHVNGGLQIVYSQVEFEGSAMYNPDNPALGGPPPAGLAGIPISGSSKSDTDMTAAVPSGYISHQYSDRVWFGFGVNAPFGLKTEYDDDWVGRYNAIKSELLTINLNPSMAFKMNDFATLGLGVSAMYADGELTNAVDGGLGATSRGVPLNPSWLPVPGVSPGLIGTDYWDNKVKMTADDWGYGFNVGLLLEPSANTRVGLHYRSKIDLELEGDAKVSGAVTAFNGKQDAELDLTLPDSASLSAYHSFNSQWAMMADVTWTHWSEVDTLDIKLADGRKSVAVWDYDDSVRVSLGAEYTHNSVWTFRTGVAVDNTPVPSDSLRSPRVPDNDRTWLAFGATYRYSPDITFDFGYAHLFVDDPEMDGVPDNHDPVSGETTGAHSVSGDYDAAVDILGVAVNWKFK